MIYEVWYRVSRAVFPFVSLRRHNEILNSYDEELDALTEAYEELGEELDATLLELEDIRDFKVTIPGVAVIASSHEPYTDYDHAVADMENDGVIDPNHYREG